MNTTLRYVRKPLPAVVMAMLALAAASASAQSNKVLSLDIESQGAGPALMQLGRAAGVQIMLTEGAGAKIEVESLKGEYRFEEALAALLNGTGLTYEFTAENVVLVTQTREGEEGESDDAALPDEDDTLELSPQIVTGSRMVRGDPSSRVFNFTAEDMAVRGVSSLEDFFRKLPYSFASMTTQTSNGQLPGADGEEISVTGPGVGISSINLRGMGSAQTLVLLNGRRIAGTGGSEQDFVNLLNVPLSAIERVDIQLDGASSVYGSDAIGGVVNFITKREYRGFSASYRQEYSSTDAHQTQANLQGGYAWSSGNVTATISRTTSEPITNEKTGWSSLDFRPILGPEFDERQGWIGQPGVACELEKVVSAWNPVPFYRCAGGFSGVVYYQLPASHSGVGATADDAVAFARNEAPAPLDEIPPQNGIDATTTSVQLNFEQYLTDDLRVYADLLWSRNESYQEYDRRISGMFMVPASNAYNPYGKHMLVSYAAIHESESGLMPAQFDQAENEARNISFGLIWSFGRSQELHLDITRTKSWRESLRLRANPTRNALDPTAEAFYAALSSSDPSRAINVFGNGTAQGTAFEEFLTNTLGPAYGVTETRQYNVTLRGELFRLWGGPITYSAGTEYRENIIFAELESAASYAFEGVEEILGSLRRTGVARPSRDIQAYYAEFAVPLFGPPNARPGLRSMVLTLQARRDVNEAVGTIGGLASTRVPARQHFWDPDDGFVAVEVSRLQQQITPNLMTAKTSRTTPRAGIHYKPSSGLTVRASWSRSFRAPPWSEQFGPREPIVRDFPPFSYDSVLDPYDPDGPTEITSESGVTRVTLNYAPDLKSETSDNYTVGLDWSPAALPELRWAVDWASVDYTNRIVSNNRYVYDHPEVVYNSPQTAIRNERGDLESVQIRLINLADKYSSLVTSQLEYTFDSVLGSFSPRLAYTHYLEDYEIVAPGTPKIEDLGTRQGNDRYKWEGSLNWQWDRWAADLWVYYTPGYVDDQILFCSSRVRLIPGNRCVDVPNFEYAQIPVSSLTTVDLTLTYRFDNGLRLRAGGTNILDRAAPPALTHSVADHQVPYDPSRWDARGRVLFLEVNWEM